MIKITQIILIFLVLFATAYETVVLAEEPLRMGIFPRRNAELTMKMYTPLSDYLTQKMGRKVVVETEKTFPRFWDKVLAARYDIVHYNQLHYILSNKGVGYDVFAKNEEHTHSNLAPAIIVRKDSGINTLEDLRGKNIAFGGGKLAMIAYVGNKLLLMENGLHENDYKSVITINPLNAAFSVFHNKTDAAATGDIALEVKALKNKISVDQLKILKTGEFQPHLPWALKSTLDDNIKEQIKDIFFNLSNSKEGKQAILSAGMTNILPASDSEYDISRNTYKSYKKLTKK